MIGIPISAFLAVASLVSGIFAILAMCGMLYFDSCKKRIIGSVLLLALTAALIFGSYWVFPKCPNCNLTQSSEFCTGCGTRIQEEYPRCPTCDVTVKTDFCGQCGHDMRGE